MLPFACALPANAATTKSEQLTVPSAASCAIAGADAAAGASFKNHSEPSRCREVHERVRGPLHRPLPLDVHGSPDSRDSRGCALTL